MGLLESLKPSLQKRQKRRDKRLSEELIECYRGGWRIKVAKGYQKTVKRDEYAHAFKFEGIKLMKGGSKYPSDNLEPLIRFLNTKVGKNWDIIYSELSRKMNKNSMLGKHLNDHLFDFVNVRVMVVNHKVYTKDAWSVGRELISSEKYPQFYVHPLNGILMKAKIQKRKK